MLAKRFLTSCLTTKSKLYNINRMNFANFNNTEAVQKALESTKGITKESFNKIKEIAKVQDKVHLFNIFGFTKWFFIITRYQIMGYCIIGALYAFYETTIKWKSLSEKEAQKGLTRREKKEISNNKTKIVIGVSTLIISGLLACYVTHFMGKRLVKDIYWLPATNEIQLNYFSLFCGSKVAIENPKYIRKLDPPRRFDTTVRHQIIDSVLKPTRLIATRGVGNWSNKELFEYIIENTEKK